VEAIVYLIILTRNALIRTRFRPTYDFKIEISQIDCHES
jgi:hypothetical protein